MLPPLLTRMEIRSAPDSSREQLTTGDQPLATPQKQCYRKPVLCEKIAAMGGRIPDWKCNRGFVARVTAAALLPGLACLAAKPRAMAAMSAKPPAQQSATAQASAELRVSVVDENGTAVASARVALIPAQGLVVKGETDYAGRKIFSGLAPGACSLLVEKDGYFAVTQPGIPVGKVATAELTLNHVREFSEQVNVIYSPPAIDPAGTRSGESC